MTTENTAAITLQELADIQQEVLEYLSIIRNKGVAIEVGSSIRGMKVTVKTRELEVSNVSNNFTPIQHLEQHIANDDD